MRRLSLLLSSLLFLSPAVIGQTLPKETRIVAPADAPVKGVQKPGDPPKEGEGPKESPRMQKLKALQFDRRAAAILRVWAGPEKKKPTEPEKKPDPIDEELAALQRHVTLGNWAEVKKYLAGLPEDEGKAGYKQLVQSLRNGPAGGGDMGGPMPRLPPEAQMAIEAAMRFRERNAFTADDVLGIAAAAPRGLDKDAISALGGILNTGITSGTVVEHVVVRFKAEADKPKDKSALTARQAAQVLTAAGQAADTGPFLPPLERATADKDIEALNLLSSHFLALHTKEKKLPLLEQAWAATQAALAAGGGSDTDKEDAIKRAVELAPRLKQELGQTWLEASFTKEPQRGMDILATIGSLSAQGMQLNPFGPDQRLKELQLQKTAVEALLKAAPDRAKDWRLTLTLLAGNWLKEAEFTYQFARDSRLAPWLNRDRYGNIFYLQDEEMMGRGMMGRQDMPRPISTGDVLEARPGDGWIGTVDEGLRPKLGMVFAQLFLKVSEEQKAFPHIEQLAKSHPDKAKTLVDEFLRVWTRTHDPNENNQYRSPYIWFYGFEQRAQSIPLTRSKQERNLDELAEWVAKLRKLNLGELNEELLAKAFTTSHSSAEVYRLDAIEKVFGKLEGLKPKTLAELAQKMRQNLAGLWREPAVQNEKKTNRKQKDIQVEVQRGYALALQVVENCLKKFPDDWSLHQARAALLHDENSYQQELSKSTEFSKKRQDALASFQKAAQLYAAKVKELSEDDETTAVYEQWMYASLGACDLQHLDEDRLPDLKQPPLIRDALRSLSGEVGERHLSKFANALFTRMSGAKPAVKFRYLKFGFEIVGEHKQAHEAKKVYDYYKDLVRELKLEAVIDGSDVVGHGKPFGVFVNLRHTREIERESGGFGRYLQNQNSNSYFSYNYGRPTADYRDKFQAAATEALKEHFEVLSVTFQTDKVNSRATKEYGWRYTPYAYLLLKPRGPQVDKVPSLRIDLDFLDTSGYVVLPIESPALPLDAKPEKGDPRPYRKLQVVQTLDERQAAQGKLIVEVKASALGLVPDLDQVLALAPEGFEVAKTDDQSVSVSKFDEASEQNAIASERTWMVTFQAKPGQMPKVFHFGSAAAEGAEMTYQRYSDADLATVTETVDLEHRYGSRALAWLWWAIGASAVGVGLLVAGVLLLRKPRKKAASTFQVPEKLTAFTVLGLLRRIQANNGLSADQQAELTRSIATLEQHYFAEDGNGQVDLRNVAESWVRRAQ